MSPNVSGAKGISRQERRNKPIKPPSSAARDIARQVRLSVLNLVGPLANSVIVAHRFVSSRMPFTLSQLSLTTPRGSHGL